MISKEMKRLLYLYNNIENKTIDDLIDFYIAFEWLHPFIDGNGRTGRLILFKESIKEQMIPIFIDNKLKMLEAYSTDNYKNDKKLIKEVCLYAQSKFLI